MTALGIYFSQQKPKNGAAKDPQARRDGPDALSAAETPPAGCLRAPRATRRTARAFPKNFPKVSGQYADYTYAQLKAFKAGERGNDAGGKDADGRVMAVVAQTLTDTQMKALADYAAGLR